MREKATVTDLLQKEKVKLILECLLLYEPQGVPFAKLRRYVNEKLRKHLFIFTLNPEYRQYLKKDAVPKKLRKAFEREEHRLPPDAKISRGRKGWMVTANEEKYIVEDAGDKLKVYLDKDIGPANFRTFLREQLMTNEGKGLVEQKKKRAPYHLTDKYFNLVLHNYLTDKIGSFPQEKMFAPLEEQGTVYGVSPEVVTEEDVDKIIGLWGKLSQTLMDIKERGISVIIQQFYENEFKSTMENHGVEKKFYEYFLGAVCWSCNPPSVDAGQIKRVVKEYVADHPLPSYPEETVIDILIDLAQQFRKYRKLYRMDFAFSFYFSFAPNPLHATLVTEEFGESSFTLPNYLASVRPQKQSEILGAEWRSLGHSGDPLIGDPYDAELNPTIGDPIMKVKTEKEESMRLLHQSQLDKDDEMYQAEKERFDFWRRKEEEINKWMGAKEKKRYEKKVRGWYESRIIWQIGQGWKAAEYSAGADADTPFINEGTRYMMKRYKEIGGDIKRITKTLKNERKLTDGEKEEIKNSLQEYL